MRKENLDQGWLYWLEGKEGEAKMVDLPHDAMIHRERIPKLKNGSYTGFYPSGNYVYVKRIQGKAEYQDKKLLLEFEGVYG